MSLEQQVAALVVASNSLTGEVAGKMGQIDQIVAGSEAAHKAWRDSLLNQLPMMALNYNHDFLDIGGTAPNQLPVGLVVNADGAFWDRFTAEIIPVFSGVDPNGRHQEAKVLLDAMGIGQGTQHFTSSFNILKLVRKDSQPIQSYAFYIPARHVKVGCGASFVCWTKTIGSAEWSWLGGKTDGVWRQSQFVWPAGTSDGRGVGTYVHIDISCAGGGAGDTLYLALPTIVLGSWPDSRKLGVITNIVNEAKRNFPSLG